jgi:hypothetical protein
MDTYLNDVIGKIELNNQSGTVCALECYYKVNKRDFPKRIGDTGSFPLGQSKTLDLHSLSIPNGAWVTAYANVNDSSGDTWIVYDKGNDSIAQFTLSGTAFSTRVSYNGIINKEFYLSDTIDELKLYNDSGTVCSLECYYKVNKSDSPKRIGNTGSFPLGQSKTLDLNTQQSLPEGAWVTAFANVSTGKDCNASTWMVYKKNSREDS